MKLSTRGRYGLKAMIDLAESYGKGNMSISALAQMQGISDSYLEQLIGSLRKAGLVVSERGAQGGYSLVRSPENISVKEVLNVLEGTTAFVECVGNEHINCTNACSCSARPLWLKIQAGINDVLETTTLRDMANDYIFQKRRNENETSLS